MRKTQNSRLLFFGKGTKTECMTTPEHDHAYRMFRRIRKEKHNEKIENWRLGFI